VRTCQSPSEGRHMKEKGGGRKGKVQYSFPLILSCVLRKGESSRSRGGEKKRLWGMHALPSEENFSLCPLKAEGIQRKKPGHFSYLALLERWVDPRRKLKGGKRFLDNYRRDILASPNLISHSSLEEKKVLERKGG